jgi:hypothetical protein
MVANNYYLPLNSVYSSSEYFRDVEAENYSALSMTSELWEVNFNSRVVFCQQRGIEMGIYISSNGTEEEDKKWYKTANNWGTEFIISDNIDEALAFYKKYAG